MCEDCEFWNDNVVCLMNHNVEEECKDSCPDYSNDDIDEDCDDECEKEN